MSWQQNYSELFYFAGSSLSPTDGYPEPELAEAEKCLGVAFPSALRDYYAVAGRETRLNHAYQRLLRPEECKLAPDYLVFFEENQCVVAWGVPLGAQVDPPVYQAAEGVLPDGAQHWHLEHDHCSAFLSFMVIAQASFGGGLEISASSLVPSSLRATLDQRLIHVAEVNGMRTYRHPTLPGRPVSFVEWTDGWRIYAGVNAESDLDALLLELGIEDFEIL